MRNLLRAVLASMIMAGCLGSSQSLAQSRAIARTGDPLAHRLAEIEREALPGIVGIGVRDLRTGRSWYVNARRQFPMASVFKVALGAKVLELSNAGKLDLQQKITIRRAELGPQHSPLAASFRGERNDYSVEDLLRRTVGDSDNTASDVLMRLVGGPSAVNRFLARHGIAGLRIDRLETQLQTDFNGLDAFRPEWAEWPKMSAAIDALPTERRRAAYERFVGDRRDTSTPVAAVDLLTKLATGKLLPPRSTELLLSIMEQTTTGPARLKAALPSGARIAHKTGNSGNFAGLSAAANDIGLITMPDGRQVAVAVFLTRSNRPLPGREQLIADVGRAVVSNLPR